MINNAPQGNYVQGQLLVRLKAQTSPEESGGLAQDYGASVLDRFELPGKQLANDGGDILLLRLPEGVTVPEAVSALEQDSRVAYAATNDILAPLEVVPDDLDPRLYGLRTIHAPQAWAITTGDREHGPVVAVIDSGVDYTHPELAPNMWTNPGEHANGQDDDVNGIVDDIHGYNAVTNTGDPMDDGSHGTHVAGTIAAVGNNGQGVVGVAWEAQIMAAKFLDGGFGTIDAAIRAVLYATAKGARITSNSWGGPSYNQALKDTLAASPALHICAAGNDGNDSDVKPLYPAAYDLDNILSVAATDQSDQLARFSNFGFESVDLAAPGVEIYSTVPGQGYRVKSGTSMATPHVTGVASLIATRFPEITNQELKDRLMFGSERLEHLEGKLVSGGRLDAVRALENDTVAPGAVEGLSVREVDPRSVALSWRASGDDGPVGRAAAYELRFSEAPDLRSAASCPLGPPQDSGTDEAATISLVPSSRERTLYVGLRTVDNVGNRSSLRTVAVTVPAADVAFENGPEQWHPEGDWGMTDYPGRGRVWTDSPAGEYRTGANDSLTSQPFTLEGFRSARLEFECKHDLEINFDRVYLEISRDGEQWTELDNYNLLAGWQGKDYDLTDFVGEPNLQIRFRLKTDLDVVKDGFYFDNLVIAGER